MPHNVEDIKKDKMKSDWEGLKGDEGMVERKLRKLICFVNIYHNIWCISRGMSLGPKNATKWYLHC